MSCRDITNILTNICIISILGEFTICRSVYDMSGLFYFSEYT